MSAVSTIADPEKVSKLLNRLAAPESIALMDGQPVNMARFAKILLANNKRDEAFELASRVLRLAPGYAEAVEIASQVLGHAIPIWHSWILRDRGRIAAFEQALQRNVARGAHVLEIGAGTGILAMMAARAGAARVASCETNPAVAAAAKEIVRLNGYSERVKIIAKHSSKLAVGVDLDRPPDLLVAEVISSDLIGEGILECLEDACGRLTRLGGRVIPARGSICVGLAYDKRLARRQIGSVAGFDLASFDRLMGPISVAIGDESLSLRGEAREIFAFDFESGGPFDNYRSSTRLISTGGPINGIAQWIRLELDTQTFYENRPSPGAKSSWAARFFPFSKTIETEAGTSFVVNAGRDARSFWLWPHELP
jgi:type III protein arginine methyltransferase